MDENKISLPNENKKKTHCKNGHELNEDNLLQYELSIGKRACKKCRAERQRIKNKTQSWKDYKSTWKKSKPNYDKDYYQQNKEVLQQKNRERWHKNRDRYIIKQKQRFQIYKVEIKIEVLTHYGNGKLQCICCKQEGIAFLTLDHINGREENDRGRNPNKKSGVRLWALLKKQNYPEGYQTLCWNCNCARQINKGICPHKQ
uniref:ORF62 n=1 Tax=Nitrosopumilaceae spindle-shaped virus TaxID=3065433 RepID=A0AAT9JH61_9VIRU